MAAKVIVTAGLLLVASSATAQDEGAITDRIQSVFDLVLRNPAEPPETLARRAREHRAMVQDTGFPALAYRQVESGVAAFQPGLPADPAAGIIGRVFAAEPLQLARLPKPRPERAIVTGSIPRAPLETDYFKRFAGSFEGSGEVKRNAEARANRVNCKLTGKPSNSGIAITGKCGVSFISRAVEANIRFDPSTNAYTGTYIGSRVGPAKLWGKRRGDSVVLTITWPKPVNGDTKATMVIRNSGNGSLAITVTDDVRPGGPKAEVTRLALDQI